eukprot:6018724-Karenia_brevis.AAC.1
MSLYGHIWRTCVVTENEKKQRGEPRHYTLPVNDCLAPQWPQNADIFKEVSISPHDSHCTM